MTFRTLEEWLHQTQKIYTLANGKYKEDDWTVQVRINDINEMIDKNILATLTPVYKDRLVEIINDYGLNDFIEWNCKHFYLIRDVIVTHKTLKYQYGVLNLPYGDDEQKYEKRIDTLDKKSKGHIPILSPKDFLSFFKQKWREQLHSHNLDMSPTEQREAQKFKDELIDELIENIVIENYERDFRGTIRITSKSKDSYILTNALIEIMRDNKKKTIPAKTHKWVKKIYKKHKLG